MMTATLPSFVARSTKCWAARKMFEFHSPIHRACGWLAILSRSAAFSGSFLRKYLALPIAFDSGSTKSFAPLRGLAVTGGGTGGSVMGALASGSELAAGVSAEAGALMDSLLQAAAVKTRAAPSARREMREALTRGRVIGRRSPFLRRKQIERRPIPRGVLPKFQDGF